MKEVLTNQIPLIDFNGCSDKETRIYDEPAFLMDLVSTPDYASIIRTLLSIVILVLVLRLIVWLYFFKLLNTTDKKQVSHELIILEGETLEPKQDEERL